MRILKHKLNIDNMPEYAFHENVMNRHSARASGEGHQYKINRSGKRHANQPAEIAKRMKYSFKGTITDDGLIATYIQNVRDSKGLKRDSRSGQRRATQPAKICKQQKRNQYYLMNNRIHHVIPTTPLTTVQD